MTYKDTAYYYRLLGLSPGADVAAVKKAYRQRAKQLHPDRNASPTAHEDFVALTEAYETLLQQLDGKTAAYQTQTGYYDAQQQARARAQAEAQKRYEDFINSDYYKNTQAGDTVASHLYLFLSVLFISGLIVFAGYFAGIGAVVAIVFAVALVSPILKRTLFDSVEVSWPKFYQSLKIVLKLRVAKTLLLALANVVLFLKVVLATVLPASLLFSLLLFFMSGAILLSRWLDAEEKVAGRYFAAFGIAPFAINLVFVINMLFAGPTYYETYRFERYQELTSGGYRPTSMIVLEGNAYNNYPLIRFFLDYDEANTASNITYTVKQGLFGPKVICGYQFW